MTILDDYINNIIKQHKESIISDRIAINQIKELYSMFEPNDLRRIKIQLSHNIINYKEACDKISQIVKNDYKAELRELAKDKPNDQELGAFFRKLIE